MPPAGYELAVPASKQLQTYDLDRAATGNLKKEIFTKLLSRVFREEHT
jgi:hypothetical protein